MNEKNIVKFLCIGGMLTALAVIFQSAPVFIPGLGLALSPISTLPIAIAGVFNIFLGIIVYFSSALILTIVSVQESMIFLFTTGLLGIVIGALLYRKRIIISTLFSSIALTLGMICLTYIVGIEGFTDMSNSLSLPITFLIYFFFSLIYASIWNICLQKFMKYLTKIN